MNEKSNGAAPQNGITLKNILLLQGVVVLYTLASICSKLTAAQPWFSFRFFAFYALEFVFLGVYAILWQQMIKRLPLSVAYANRASAILWSMLWAVIFFHENITVQNLAGVAVVLCGTLVVNSDGE